jgi:deoxyxylulose-5-phosphate synthase
VADEVKADATGQAARERTQDLTLQAAMTANGQLLDHLENAIVSLDSVGESSERDYEYASTLTRCQADLRFALSDSKKLEKMALAAAATAGAARETAAEFSAQVIDAGIAEAEAMVLEAARTCSSTRIISSSSSLSPRVFSEVTRSSSRASC